MGKKEVKEPVILTAYENVCTNFISKMSVISMVILISIAYIGYSLMSMSSEVVNAPISLSFNQLSILVIMIAAVIGGLILIVPIIIQSFIYIFEDVPDEKLPIKRTVNKMILGFMLLSIVIMILIIPALDNIYTTYTFYAFLLAIIMDLTLAFLKITKKVNLSYQMICILSAITGIILFFTNRTTIGFFSVLISKLLIVEVINLTDQFKTSPDGKKRNARVLIVTVILSIYIVILFFLFKQTIQQYIHQDSLSLVEVIYCFFHKCITENPFGVSKIINSGNN